MNSDIKLKTSFVPKYVNLLEFATSMNQIKA